MSRVYKHSDATVKEHLLGAFAKLRKATVSVVICVRMEQLGSYWTNFHEV